MSALTFFSRPHRLAHLRLCLVLVLALVAGCAPGAASPDAAQETAIPRACEDAYEDLVRYFDGDAGRRRPPGLTASGFVASCQELPGPAQSCMLFSYLQAHASQCDEELKKAPPDVMRRLAVMTGK